jgi:IS30 family transposase
MGKGYRHLGLKDRDTISEMERKGHTMAEIAAAEGRSKSTISRELKRNSTPAYKAYLPCKAHERAVMEGWKCCLSEPGAP